MSAATTGAGAGATRAGAAATTAVLTTLALAASAWVVAVHQMNEMSMGGMTGLGSLAFFVGLWTAMMAAMMLPGAAPAIWNQAQAGRRLAATPVFLASYLALWTLVGIAIYPLYRPHEYVAAGAVVMAAGIYELTPFKQRFRRRCRDTVRSGFEFGIYCVGSTLGLMLMLVALGVMSVAWMAVVAVLVLGQKLVPPKPLIDVPVAIAVVGLGILMVAAPSWVPGLMPSM
jgi:predicted metal-binding membrane protein